MAWRISSTWHASHTPASVRGGGSRHGDVRTYPWMRGASTQPAVECSPSMQVECPPRRPILELRPLTKTACTPHYCLERLSSSTTVAFGVHSASPPHRTQNSWDWSTSSTVTKPTKWYSPPFDLGVTSLYTTRRSKSSPVLADLRTWAVGRRRGGCVPCRRTL